MVIPQPSPNINWSGAYHCWRRKVYILKHAFIYVRQRLLLDFFFSLSLLLLLQVPFIKIVINLLCNRLIAESN
jgi:hypothetical protein